MIDLHTHTVFSDGVLVPAELCRRAQVAGYTGLAITDHVDISNLEIVVPAIIRFCRSMPGSDEFRVVSGVEITHALPEQIPKLVRKARKLGARIVLVHGESPVEPVAAGTNQAAIEAGVDILAHPGLIRPDEVKLAAEKGVYLEITARGGHSLANGHVATLAKRHGAELILNTDTHEPDNLISDQFALSVVQGAGLSAAEFQRMQARSEKLLKKAARVKK